MASIAVLLALGSTEASARALTVASVHASASIVASPSIVASDRASVLSGHASALWGRVS